MNEDLNVMAKLIDDTVSDDDNSPNRAMGIAVAFFPGNNSARHLYVEGHGAIFQTSVHFPLVASEKDSPAEPAKPVKNSAWESARREVYGSPDDSDAPGAAKREVFSPERVDALKKSILRALANANNLRHLKPTDKITVAVRSGGKSPGRAVRPVSTTSSGNTGGSTVFATRLTAVINRAPDSSEKTLTISVKKSDADALADGKIKEDEFNKRATIALY
jgi:hypothetical protein